MQTIPANIDLTDGKAVKIIPYEQGRWYINFRALGAFDPCKPDSLCAIQYIARFSKPELFLFNEVCKHTEENSRLTLRRGSYNSPDQERLRVAIRKWIDKNLMQRIKREHYMVNPWFLVPPKEQQLDAINRWKALKASHAHSKCGKPATDKG